MSAGQLRIVSDGLGYNTILTVDGKELCGATAVTWRVDSVGFATATAEFENVAVDVVGTIAPEDEAAVAAGA